MLEFRDGVTLENSKSLCTVGLDACNSSEVIEENLGESCPKTRPGDNSDTAQQSILGMWSLWRKLNTVHVSKP